MLLTLIGLRRYGFDGTDDVNFETTKAEIYEDNDWKNR